MTYVITEACIGVKEGSCVDVCPAGCIHTTPEAPQNFIDPDVCIECEQCVLVCPVNAIFLDSEVPEEWRHYIDINARFFQANKAAAQLSAADAAAMLREAQAYAARAGTAVAVVVIDATGETVACAAMDGCAAEASELAARKAYTALVYELPSQDVRKGGLPPWFAEARVEQQRVLAIGGGWPLVAGKEVIGAIGIAGSPSPAQDVLCCQAALAARTQPAAHHA